MIPKCIPTLGVTLVWESQIFRTLVGKENKHQIGAQDTIRKVLKRKCLKCPRIIHFDLIYISYEFFLNKNQIVGVK